MDEEETKVPGLMTDAETIKSLELSLKNARYDREVLVQANNKLSEFDYRSFDKVIKDSINRIGFTEIEDEVTDNVYRSLSNDFVKKDEFDMLVDERIVSEFTEEMVIDVIKNTTNKDSIRKIVIELVNEGLITLNADG